MGELLNQFRITPMQLRVFLGSLIAVFAIVSLQYLGVRAPKIIWPIPQKPNIFDNVLPKLEERENNFMIKQESGIVQTTYAASNFEQAASFALMDFDSGQILASKNLTKPLPIASLTKIMTAIVALDLALPSDTFIVSKTAASEIPTVIGVKQGNKMTLGELLPAMLLASANDAAEVVREGIDQKYGPGIFIHAMNAKAIFLGLKNSHFENPQGFDDPNHYSSAEDLAILAHYAITNYPLIAGAVKKDYEFLPANSEHKQFDLYNWNGLLDVYPNIIGLKIGDTDKAGMTTVVLSERGGKKILVVVLGAPDIIKRDLWASELLDLGYQQTMGLNPVNVTENQLLAKYNTWKYWD